MHCLVSSSRSARALHPIPDVSDSARSLQDYIMGAGTCGKCGSIETFTTMITFVTLVAIVLGCIVVVVIYRRALALAEFIWKLLGFQLKICFAQAQILAQIPIMLETGGCS